MKHIVALSGGKDSTALALALNELEPRNYTYICTPTGNELPEMIEHWVKLGKILGKRILPVTNGRSLGGLIQQQNALPNWRMRWCTRMLKIEPFERYVMANTPCTVYVGIRADEADRDGVKWEEADGVCRRYPLVEWGWGLGDVVQFLERKCVTIPDRTDCAGCFFQTLWEWFILYMDYRDQYEECCRWEDETGHTLRSDKRDTWPASLRELALEFDRGRVPREPTKMKDRPAMCSVCAR